MPLQTYDLRDMPPCIEPPAPQLASRPSPRSGEGGLCLQTRDPSALEGLGNDGCRLVLGLAKGLAELLHAVSVHNDGVPAGDREGAVRGKGQGPEDPEGFPGKGLPSIHRTTTTWKRAAGAEACTTFLFPIWVFFSLFTLFHFLLFAWNRFSSPLLSNSKLSSFIASFIPGLFISYRKLLWGQCTDLDS